MQAKENLMTDLTIGNPFHGAALLDEQGHEIPITEEMIMRACDELMKLWQFPGKAN